MRGAILIGIVVMLAITLVPTLRSVLAQRGESAALQQTIEQQGQTVAALQRKAALWNDPDFIEVQARERLTFVRVGDRAYSVIDPAASKGADAAQAPARRTVPVVAAPLADDRAPWYGKAWQSIQIADRPSAGLPPKP